MLLLTHCLDVWNPHPIVYWFLMLLLLSFVVGLVVLFYWGVFRFRKEDVGQMPVSQYDGLLIDCDVLGQPKISYYCPD